MTLITVIIDLEIKDLSSRKAHAYVKGMKKGLLTAKKKDSDFIRSIEIRTIVHEGTTGEES